MLSKFREPVSSITHLIGAILSTIGLILLIKYSLDTTNVHNTIILAVFGISSILLYCASSTYHKSTSSKKVIKILRRVDHSMIYVLIAGTYTPICLIALKGTMGTVLFVVIWLLALIGIILKIVWFDAPRWLYTGFYILMGWISIFAIVPIIKAVSLGGFMWLLAGGLFYTIGGLIYATKWPKINLKLFGFHEIFHIFIMLGSLCLYILMFKYIMYIN
ncbi:hemolysin III family protein [Clostridium tagluense]|uniref:PAQR family membrane homeostasis protein TrhA n=1 Tax=Clostridium tagluense TaxID=360422 RepID=UPI001C0D2828|nr:hemolysin III family protein [Clostridium tagluense]MBU3127308.1 hemolysin III family protein [Clostridium tagluense]MCB2311218.1 hemolysin III family protein [Clostridium tagluense]MCB2315942.1 hemolysin III family protein [Clostridium tagluense]MCB2320711.1 hemolysin III family protein [Clostridium tagluense]MCB2325728.1 hemolysin III family protein [Clostridium tagluense]